VADFPDQDVEIDKMRVQQILVNLLSNAIKFSKPLDKIRVEISYPHLLPDNLHEFSIKVTDQGIGLNEVDRKHLFEPNFKSSCEQNL
jgi:signal transduction histidine kinase